MKVEEAAEAVVSTAVNAMVITIAVVTAAAKARVDSTIANFAQIEEAPVEAAEASSIIEEVVNKMVTEKRPRRQFKKPKTDLPTHL